MKASHLYVYFIFQVVWVLDLSPGNVDKQGQSKYNNPQTGRKVIYHYFGRILLVITNLSMFQLHTHIYIGTIIPSYFSRILLCNFFWLYATTISPTISGVGLRWYHAVMDPLLKTLIGVVGVVDQKDAFGDAPVCWLSWFITRLTNRQIHPLTIDTSINKVHYVGFMVQQMYLQYSWRL